MIVKKRGFTMKKMLCSHKSVIIFILFFGLVLLQHQFLWLYHDDYGYASLSYAYNVEEVIGQNFSISQLFSFLIGHYNVWGGRILYFFIECVSLKIGLPFFRLLQSLVLTGIFYFIYKIVTKITKKEDWKIALASCLCYGLIEIMAFRDGLFWVSASVLYIFPLLPFFAFVYFYTFQKEKNSIWYTIMNALLLFAASFSQEQIGIMAVGYIILFTIYEWYQTKKINHKNLMMCIIGLVGFFILLLAPGNVARMHHSSTAGFYELSLLAKIRQNLPQIVFANFGTRTRIFSILFFIIVGYICMQNIRKNRGIQILNDISIISCLIILVFTLYQKDGYFYYITHIMSSNLWYYLSFGTACIQLLFIFYSLAIYFYDKSYPILILICASMMSQGSMIVAPGFASRSAFPFEFVMFLVFIYIFMDFMNQNKKFITPLCVLLAVSVISIFNYTMITVGYYQNNDYHQENDQILRTVSKEIQNGKEYGEIKLHKMKNDLYTGELPYFDGYDYITYWICEYYNLPNDVIITYE